MYTDAYLSMKELAAIFGTTQKRIGRALEALGLWEVGEGPTSKARQKGYVGLRYYPNREKYPLTVWHKEKTIAILEDNGFTRVDHKAVPPQE